MNADDSFDRKERRFEAHYFHSAGTAEVAVPAGKVTVDIMKGFEYRFERRTVQVDANQDTRVAIRLKALDTPRDPRRSG